jgi:hypothetical protein
MPRWWPSVSLRPWQFRQLNVAKLFAVVWQFTHAVRCGPDEIGKRWLKVPWVQLESLFRWQLSHVVGNPAAAWFGDVVRS